MEVVLHVSEEELREFPEEASGLEGATTPQEQGGKVSPTQGTVLDLLSLYTSPTFHLLDRIHRGQVRHLLGKSPKGGSYNRDNRFQKNKACNQPVHCYIKQPVDSYSKRPVNCHSKRPDR